MDPGGSKKTIECVYQLFKKISCGADGSVSGINGSIRPSCLAHVLDALIVDGRELIDFGAGDGRVLVASLAKGASRAHGYELPANGAHQFVLNAVLEKIRERGRVHWISKDINNLSELPGGASCAFSFWVGIPLVTQENILRLCATSHSIKSLGVFRDSKWRNPDDGELLKISLLLFGSGHLTLLCVQ